MGSQNWSLYMFASITLDPGQVNERILDFSGLLREGYGFGSPLPQIQGSHAQQW